MDFWLKNPLEGYRRCTYMMIDQNIVAASPSSVYRVLAKAGLIRHWAKENSKIGEGFEQPLAPHEHWHVDIYYLNIRGTFIIFTVFSMAAAVISFIMRFVNR